MRTITHIFSFEWKRLWRSNVIKTLILIVFAAGIYGILFGKFEIDKQKAKIAEVKEFERQEFDKLLNWAILDTSFADNKKRYLQAVSPAGVGWNKHFNYYISNKTPATAGLCLGQRDLYPVYYGFNMTDLSRQVNVSVLANPMKLLSGNFDLSYVFIFLFPLLIVALFYDLYAAEKEGGTLTLLQSQSTSLKTVLFAKGLLKLLIIWGLAVVLLILGFTIQGISITQNFQLFLSWLMVICSYNLLWVLLIVGIVSLRKKAALSAMMGLGVWVIFTLITPAFVNLYILAKEPLPNRAEMIHTIRNLNGVIWDAPKSFVFDKFYPKNPQYNKGDSTDFNKWYYASFSLIDEEANQLQEQFEIQVNNRNVLLEKWKWLTPAALIHDKLSELSQTDRESHQLFLSEVQLYHKELRKFYLDRIFEEKNFSINDLKTLEKKL